MDSPGIRFDPLAISDEATAELHERFAHLVQSHCLIGLPTEEVKTRIRADSDALNDTASMRWLRTPNPMLGGISPEQAIIQGRAADAAAVLKQTWPTDH